LSKRLPAVRGWPWYLPFNKSHRRFQKGCKWTLWMSPSARLYSGIKFHSLASPNCSNPCAPQSPQSLMAKNLSEGRPLEYSTKMFASLGVCRYHHRDIQTQRGKYPFQFCSQHLSNMGTDDGVRPAEHALKMLL